MLVWRFVSGLLLLGWGSAVLAVPPTDRSRASPADKIVITSQSLVFKNQESTAVFDGKVVMTKVGFIMHADHMVVYFQGQASPTTDTGKTTVKAPPPATGAATPGLPTFGNRAVTLVEAMGNVMIEQGGKKAKSKKAVYSQHDDKLVLTGDPEVWEEGYHITGLRMTMFLTEDRSIVEGSRVIINEANGESR